MRQVPKEFQTLFRPLFIGRGKLARHLQHYFNLTKRSYDSWDDARDLDHPGFLQNLSRCNAVWILVTDRAIPMVHAQILELIQKQIPSMPIPPFIHSSGANELPGMITLHPLMTFGPALYSLEQYESIPFTRFKEECDFAPVSFLNFLKEIPNPKYELRMEQRGFYHASCVMMSNFPQILWNTVSQATQQSMNVPSSAFEPILKQSLNNFFIHGPHALTGPLARGDHTTQQKNLTSLLDSPPQGPSLAKLYLAFIEFYEQTHRQSHSQEESHDHRSRFPEV